MVRAAAGALVALALLPAAPSAAAERCAGERVTISYQDKGVGVNILGTNGPDVIQGGPQLETIQGAGGNDTICGGDGDDRIGGGADRDELHGEDGDDRFSGPDLGMDIVVGGPGRRFTDTALYAKSPVGIRLNMRNGLVLADGARARGGIQGIENVYGTNHDDVLTGDDRAQFLHGQGENDVVDGREGSDELYGGPGIDGVTYATADAALVIDLAEERARVGKGLDANIDTVGPFEIVIGSRFNDKITGRDAAELLAGGPGDDEIKALLGEDVLRGDEGDDTLFPGPGNDTVDGGANGPVTGTGAPGDLVSYQGDKITDDRGATSYEFSAYLGENEFFPDKPQESFGVGHDLFAGIESVRGPQRSRTSYFQGDDGPNVLIGGNGFDVIGGEGGNDLLFGLGNEDSIYGEAGDDFLDGGAPVGENDADAADGGEGDDTCLGAQEIFENSCETTD